MKFTSIYLLLFSLILFSCQDNNKKLIQEQQKEAKKRELVFNNINRGWVFNISPLDPVASAKINNWMGWRNFMTEINQKPKSTIGAFQKKASDLAKKTDELAYGLPEEFNKPAIKARIAVVITKIKSLDLFIHLDQIPDGKVVKLIGEINTEIDYLQLQMEEIVKRSQIPVEEGEADLIKMKDTTRAIPNELK